MLKKLYMLLLVLCIFGFSFRRASGLIYLMALAACVIPA